MSVRKARQEREQQRCPVNSAPSHTAAFTVCEGPLRTVKAQSHGAPAAPAGRSPMTALAGLPLPRTSGK